MPGIFQKGNTEETKKAAQNEEFSMHCSMGAVAQKPSQSACEYPFGNRNQYENAVTAFSITKSFCLFFLYWKVCTESVLWEVH